MNLSDKKIAILGLGIEGEDGVKFLLSQGVDSKNITVFDQKPLEELKEKISQLGIKNYQLGKDYLKNGLRNFDIIFRSPAFKLSMPEIVEAKKKGAIITSATKLFFDLCPGRIIGVTGTKGKGTTSSLIYQILKEAGKKVFLAGNIGEPMLALLPKLNRESWVVLELSSFQLQDLEKSPYVAVVLFIVSEHLDYHKDFKEYLEAKANIVKYQKKSDFAVLNADNKNSAALAKLTPAKVFWFSRRKKVNGGFVDKGKIFVFDQLVGEVKDLKIRGEHNWENVASAVTVGKILGVSLEKIRKAVFSFKGLEHRLELVAKIKGVSFYNDSFSTTPETTIAAVKSFNQPLILILGGSDKGSDYRQMAKEIVSSTVKTVVLIGQMAPKIKKELLVAGFKGKIIFRPKTMKEIVEKSFAEAKKGDVVLLSPACASFDMFKNYKDRGWQFKSNVANLAEK